MANQINAQYLVNANGAWTYMARITGVAGANITQASLTGTISRSLTSPAPGRAVTTTALVIASTVYDTLQTGSPWDTSIDATGYNFLDAVSHLLVTAKGIWKLQYTFVTVTTSVEFKTHEVDLVAN